MKITLLVDSVASGAFAAEFGLSLLLERDGRTILFDTKGRKKARLGAAVSYLGYHGMRWIYKRVNP